MRIGRLAVLLVVSLGVAVALLAAAAGQWLRRDLEARLWSTLEREARLVAASLPSDSSGRLRALARHGRALGLRITLFAADGRPLGDTELTPDDLVRLEATGTRPEVEAARAGRVGRATRRVSPAEETATYLAIPSDPIVRLTASLAGIEGSVRRVRVAVAGGAVLVLLLAAAGLLLLRRPLARQIGDLAGAARHLGYGEPPQFLRLGVPALDTLAATLRAAHQETARHFDELAHERREGESLVDAMLEGVLACDRRGRVLRANPAARRLLGYGPEEPLPPLGTLFHHKPARDLADAALRGETVTHAELRLDETTLLASARPLPGRGTVIVLHDVSDLRRLETVRQDFVANVSHELKTPLTSITGYVETLLHDDLDPDTTRRFLETIQKNAKRMHDLIEDQLDLARIESGRYLPRPEPVPVPETIQGAWSGMAQAAARRGIRFRVEVASDAEVLTVDPNALRQILSNLLSNAVRYAGAEGEIRCVVRRIGSGTTLEVSDTGIGMAGEHLTRIFERFYRVDPARSREEGGTGLGLAIVKHLVESHGGQVGAESTLGRGTTIRCWIPDPPPPA